MNTLKHGHWPEAYPIITNAINRPSKIFICPFRMKRSPYRPNDCHRHEIDPWRSLHHLTERCSSPTDKRALPSSPTHYRWKSSEKRRLNGTWPQRWSNRCESFEPTANSSFGFNLRHVNKRDWFSSSSSSFFLTNKSLLISRFVQISIFSFASFSLSSLNLHRRIEYRPATSTLHRHWVPTTLLNWLSPTFVRSFARLFEFESTYDLIVIQSTRCPHPIALAKLGNLVKNVWPFVVRPFPLCRTLNDVNSTPRKGKLWWNFFFFFCLRETKSIWCSECSRVWSR